MTVGGAARRGWRRRAAPLAGTGQPGDPLPALPFAAEGTRAPRDGRAVVAEGLTKRFGERTACEDVSFEVGDGEVFGLLGPNGAGKTTMVRMLGTLLAPTSGTARVAGVEIGSGSSALVRSRISIMPESPGLYQRLTVAENLAYFAALHGLEGAQERVRRALAAVHLSGRADDPCGALSKGLRQRVALARALLNEPRVLFLDEPTSGLDPVAAREVHDLVEELRERGTTIVLTTHRLEEAERLCNRVAILNTTLRLVGRPEDLRRRLFQRALHVRAHPLPPDVDHLWRSVPGVDAFEQVGDDAAVLTVADPDAVAPAVVRALVAAGIDVVSIGEVRRSLEDVYLQLVDEDVEARER